MRHGQEQQQQQQQQDKYWLLQPHLLRLQQIASSVADRYQHGRVPATDGGGGGGGRYVGNSVGRGKCVERVLVSRRVLETCLDDSDVQESRALNEWNGRQLRCGLRENVTWGMRWVNALTIVPPSTAPLAAAAGSAVLAAAAAMCG